MERIEISGKNEGAFGQTQINFWTGSYFVRVDLDEINMAIRNNLKKVTGIYDATCRLVAINK